LGDGSAFDWTSRRILIVDSDEQFRFFARGLFKHHRVRDVLSIAHAAEIPRILAHHKIHVAFVELTHEETGVAQMLQWLRNSKDSPAPALPVILLTKTLDKEQLARACVFGIHGVLQKPLSGEKMLKAAIGVITNPRMFKPIGQTSTSSASTTKGKPVSFQAKAFVPSGKEGAFAAPKTSLAPVAGEDNSRKVKRSGEVGVEPLHIPHSRKESTIELAENPTSRVPSEWIDEVPEIPKSHPWDIEPTKAKPVAVDPGFLETASPKQKKVKTEPAFPEIELLKQKKTEETTGPTLEEILALHVRWVQEGGRDGRRANLEGRDLLGLPLADTVLTSALLRRADLSGSDFTGAEMHGVDLRDAEALGCKFNGANLAVARLRHAKLRGCLFAQSSLKGADLAGADLTEAKLGDADLTGAILLGACLDGADLSAVSGLTQGQLEGVSGNASTRLPPGLFVPPSEEDDRS
jgi:DNA-binding NarL/FixJ family response regulator